MTLLQYEIERDYYGNITSYKIIDLDNVINISICFNSLFLENIRIKINKEISTKELYNILNFIKKHYKVILIDEFEKIINKYQKENK